MAESNRVHPMASVRLYDPGADGYATDLGWWVRDILSQSWPQARPDYAEADGKQYPTTFLIEDLGIVAPNFTVNRRHTHMDYVDGTGATILGHWTGTSNAPAPPDKLAPMPDGGWVTTSQQACGDPLYLYQVFPLAGYWYRLDSDFDLPENPWFSFTLMIEGVDRDETDPDQPYVDVVFGGGSWAIGFRPDRQKSPVLYKAEGGEWFPCRVQREGSDKTYETLRTPPNFKWQSIMSQDQVNVVGGLVIFARDALGISWDEGDTWDVYRDSSGVSCPQGQVSVQGSGQSVGWWWNELRPVRYGTEAEDPKPAFESQRHPIFEPRVTQPTYTVEEDYHKFLPEGTEVDVDWTSTDADDESAYRAEFIVAEAAMAGAPFSSWRFPTLTAVDFWWPAVLLAPQPLAYTELTAPGYNGITSVTVNQPRDLAANTAKIDTLLEPSVTFSGEYRLRYFEIDLGFRYRDGTYRLWQTFAGYCENVETRQVPEWRRGHRLSFSLVDATLKFKRSKVDEGFPPLGGEPVNDALTALANKCGWPTARIAFEATTVSLSDSGSADDPLWHWAGPNSVVRVGMSVWELMTTIADFAGMELFVTGDGVLRTRLRGTVLPAVHVFDGQPANIDNAVREIELSAETLEGTTATIVRGTDALERAVVAYAIDFTRERQPGVADVFVSWRDSERVDGEQFRDLADAIRVANLGYAAGHESRMIAGVQTYGNPGVIRRERMEIDNVAVGTLVTDRFLIEEANHDWGSLLKDVDSQFVGRRL